MKKLLIALLFISVIIIPSFSQEDKPKPPAKYAVEMIKDAENGWTMQIDGVPTPIYGMVWSFTPIGENYVYNLWNKPEGYIKQMIDIDAQLMKDMGVNVIRSFSTIPPKWVTYLYEEYGIYTSINYLFARYGVSVNNKWYPRTNYSDPDVRELLIKETLESIETYKNVPGVLMFLLGNENNYGLEWTSDEIENLPKEERHKGKAEYLYSILGESIREAKKHTDLPIGIVNGDVLYIDLIAKHAPEIDFLGTNVYRGKVAYDPTNPYSSPFFEKVEEILDKPVLFTEFGADAYNTILKSEDQYHQAEYLVAQWEDMFKHSYGKGRTQNAIGGFIFEWIDEWWKRGLDKELTTQGVKGSWINGGYAFDFIPEQWDTHGNMNEEWLGVVAQSEEFYGGGGFYNKINKRIPRAAYYAVADIWKEDMYDITNEEIALVFSKDRNSGIDITGAVARANDIALRQRSNALHLNWISVSPSIEGAMREHFSDFDESLDFSYMQTANLVTELNPTPWFGARMNLRFQYEALDDVFDKSYEYALLKGADTTEEQKQYRVPVEFYSSSFLIENEFVDVEGLFHDGYRVTGGHTDWVTEGDFFGLLPETFYLADLDRNFSKAPFGAELTFHQFAEGLKIYGGPEIFKEARPSVMAKYYREFYGVKIGGLVEQELSIPNDEEDKNADGYVDNQLRRKASVILGYTTPFIFNNLLSITLEGGALMSGLEKVDREYTATISDDTYERDIKSITPEDIMTYKGRLLMNFNTNPVLELWAEYIHAGLVSDSRGIKVRDGSYMGSKGVGDYGTGNRQEAKGGFVSYYGFFSLAASALWRRPLSNAINKETLINGEPGKTLLRDPLSDPFFVYGNRETLQAEVMLSFDQTGATYFHEWNNDDREDAVFATSLGFHYTFYNGRTDAISYKNDVGGYYVWEEGLERTTDLPAGKIRIVSNFLPEQKVILTSSAAKTQNTSRNALDNGDAILPEWQYSGALTYIYKRIQISPAVDWNVFGPEDWHAEFNHRIPVQWNMYMAYHFDKVSLSKPTKLIYAEAQGRHFDGIDSAERAGRMVGINPLGNVDDGYRVSVTLGYKLTF